MKDIVQRLRDDDDGDPALPWEAADAIEGLRKSLKTMENTARINLWAYKNLKGGVTPLSETEIAALCGGASAKRRLRRWLANTTRGRTMTPEQRREFFVQFVNRCCDDGLITPEEEVEIIKEMEVNEYIKTRGEAA